MPLPGAWVAPWCLGRSLVLGPLPGARVAVTLGCHPRDPGPINLQRLPCKSLAVEGLAILFRKYRCSKNICFFYKHIKF